jgi:hypothetical protein
MQMMGNTSFGLQLGGGFIPMPSKQLATGHTASRPFSAATPVGSATGYQVPVGKTLRIYGVKVYAKTSTVGSDRFDFGYADNSDVCVSSAPTNYVKCPINNGGADSFGGTACPYGVNAAGGLVADILIQFDVPATKYLMAQFQGSTSATMIFFGDLI